MEYTKLGNTGLEVSRICFGTLTIGPLQANLDIQSGAEIIVRAIERGINFFDTAQLYKTYKYLKTAMKASGKHDLIISTKTYAYSAKQAIAAVEEARRELDRDIIDIFMLHEQESIHTMRGHKEALDVLYKYKAKGVIKAVGASMHHIAAVEGADKFAMDVIHPILNLEGLGIVDGNRRNMERAIAAAAGSGIGVFSMKPLGGGNLFGKAAECLKYAFSQKYVHSVAIGMQTAAEVDANCNFYENDEFCNEEKKLLTSQPRKIHIESWCSGCSECVRRCPHKALTIKNNRAFAHHAKCVLCGYCAPVCGQWAIKIV